MIYLIMGVSGSGKTTLGELLASRLGCRFDDADTFHSQANKDKMAKGIALTDEDRWPWLDAIHDAMQQAQAEGTTRVFACSALKKIYRDRLLSGLEGVRLLFLKGSPELLAERIGSRRGHFFDPKLLQSQLDTLEAPDHLEAQVLDVRKSPEQLVDEVLASGHGA
ncbi:gluconokinase [Pseudomonas sp. HR1]|uniref:gluconokinase n=1 Tax=Pseudomonas TaxID=286 RepID=UPI000D39F27A|nr:MULTISPECIES: gluconokinase [Pseudomonas]MDK4197599.1 gluconokinase [Pseudomonas sp. HR1]QEU04649.1 gluconokinase [Pseudomonas oryzihabitans]RAU36002.1 gluconokinase [Pseudomonas sp. RIT 411]HCV78958.1 gluconokinase [Pseudomonas sp.]